MVKRAEVLPEAAAVTKRPSNRLKGPRSNPSLLRLLLSLLTVASVGLFAFLLGKLSSSHSELPTTARHGVPSPESQVISYDQSLREALDNLSYAVRLQAEQITQLESRQRFLQKRLDQATVHEAILMGSAAAPSLAAGARGPRGPGPAPPPLASRGHRQRKPTNPSNDTTIPSDLPWLNVTSMGRQRTSPSRPRKLEPLQRVVYEAARRWASGDEGSALPTAEALGAAHAKAERHQDVDMHNAYFRFRPDLVHRGVYVEFGARNGIDGSNTLFFEKELGWSGVLLEADVREFPALARTRPGALSVFGAVGAMDDAEASFMVSKLIGWSGFAKDYNRFRKDKGACPCVNVSVPIHRLNTILGRVGIAHVNYMSIDTEGSELSILKTIDFDAVYFEYVQVEVVMLRQTMADDIANREAIELHMKAQGFSEVQVFSISSNTFDLVFENQRPVPEELGQEANQVLNWDSIETAATYLSKSAEHLARAKAEMEMLVRLPPPSARRSLRGMMSSSLLWPWGG